MVYFGSVSGCLLTVAMGPGDAEPGAKASCWPPATLPPLPAPGSAARQELTYPSQTSGLIPALDHLG